VSVRDFGPGVPEHLLETVFEPFFRGQDELTRRQKGTGIGLSLVRDLVERMGGRVRALAREPGLEVEIWLLASAQRPASSSG
jgi:signal transduction histidine kinase